jgi:hypothetical protein
VPTDAPSDFTSDVTNEQTCGVSVVSADADSPLTDPALAPWIWTVRAYEKPRRGRVVATRYSVLACSEEEAVAFAREHHEIEACPETHDARYVAVREEKRVSRATLVTMSRETAEKQIAAGLA